MRTGITQAMRGVAAVFAVSAATTGSAEIIETTPTDYGYSRIVEVDGDQYQVFAYTSTTETWTVPIPDGVTSVEYLVVGGGGGGGTAGNARGGGGGGAGGFLSDELTVTPGASLSVTVGAGGAAGKPGSASFLGSVEAWGGGAGNSGEGASGGGAQGWSNAAGGVAKGNGAQGSPGCPDAGQHKFGGGGGGGAASAGANGSANSNNGTAGGAGKSSGITGESVVYAAGGGGGAYDTYKGTAGAGGSDGVGGQGGSSKGSATTGQANTGSGGGGGTYNLDGNAGAAGADGIVVVRYLITDIPSKTSFTGATLTINPSTVEYDGNVHTVELTDITLADGTVVDLSEVLEGRDYELSQKSFGPDVGVYTVKLTGIGDSYTGETSTSFAIIDGDGILSEETTDYGLKRLIRENGKKYVVEIYTSTASDFTFKVPNHVTELQYLMVGGGGGGGGHYGGGGGAGGLITDKVACAPGSTWTVSVGKGGKGGTGTATGTQDIGEAGGSSVLENSMGDQRFEAFGGGYGGGIRAAGGDGGSGGGAGGSCSVDQSVDGGQAESGQGHAGGSITEKGHSGCGGGGAGRDGSCPPVCESQHYVGGTGGAGITLKWTGEEIEYAKGGNGGGNAGYVDVQPGMDGRGSGGGGGLPLSAGYKGGSGIVALRYLATRSNGLIIIFSRADASAD